MYYGNYNKEGFYIGFYSKEIHGDKIPKPNIPLSPKEWQEATTGDYKVVGKKHTFFLKPGPTEEELSDWIRTERNSLLSSSDWTQFPDSPLSPEKKSEWSIYRQKLRDILENCDVHNPIYPTKPNK